MSLPPAGWYLDPDRAGQQRYWGGRQWTDHRAPLATAPQPRPPGAARDGHHPAHATAVIRAGMVPAGWWARFGASLLDGLLVLVVAVLVGMALGVVLGLAGLATEDSLTGIDALFEMAGYVIPPLVYAKFIADKGWSPGKKALGLVVVDASTRSPTRLTYGKAVGRELAKYLSAIPLLLGYLWAAWDPHGEAWHDKMAGARVMKADAGRLAPPGRPAADLVPPNGPRPAVVAGVVAGWSSADLPTRPTTAPASTVASRPPSSWQSFGS